MRMTSSNISPSRRNLLKTSGMMAAGAALSGLFVSAFAAGPALAQAGTPQLPRVRYVPTNGIRMAVYEAGCGPALVLLHGWPELAYSWRNQIPAIAAAGYRVIVPDQRGYGLTDRPDPVEAYDMAHLTGDLVGLLDALGVERAVFCGHDWGGLVAWQLPLFHANRVAGVIGVNTPFVPRLPIEPVEMLRFIFGDDMYVVQMHDYGKIDAVLNREADRFFRTQMRKHVIGADAYFKLPRDARRLDFLTQFGKPPTSPPFGEPLMAEAELRVFIDTYRRTGFTGGINWYRNLTRNWHAAAGVEQTIGIPSLMISAADDVVLPPSLTDGMEAYVPDLEKHVIPDCGHWTQQEKPAELTALMVDWLGRRFPSDSEDKQR
jgi:soluble epoxide hydrolase/lipid-phosphate phosphatase